MLAELYQKLEDVSHQLTAIKKDATSLPFADNSFDVALTVHVFHLVSAWKQALAEIRRVLIYAVQRSKSKLLATSHFSVYVGCVRASVTHHS